MDLTFNHFHSVEIDGQAANLGGDTLYLDGICVGTVLEQLRDQYAQEPDDAEWSVVAAALQIALLAGSFDEQTLEEIAAQITIIGQITGHRLSQIGRQSEKVSEQRRKLDFDDMQRLATDMEGMLERWYAEGFCDRSTLFSQWTFCVGAMTFLGWTKEEIIRLTDEAADHQPFRYRGELE